jgi:hypothetical protein
MLLGGHCTSTCLNQWLRLQQYFQAVAGHHNSAEGSMTTRRSIQEVGTYGPEGTLLRGHIVRGPDTGMARVGHW